MIRSSAVGGLQFCCAGIDRLRAPAPLLCYPIAARRQLVRASTRTPSWASAGAGPRGCQLPKLSKILTNRTTRWTKIVMPEWYGGERHTLEIVTGTAIWYHSGLPPLPIRWLLVRDPSGVRAPQAFLCTDLDATPAQILGWFVQRWSIESTFQEVREYLERQWSDLTILPATPALLGLYFLITIWANTLGGASGFIHPGVAAWYTKSELTFSEAIAAFRRALWSPPNFSMSRKKERHRGNSRRTPTTTHRDALLRCIKWAKSSSDDG